MIVSRAAKNYTDPKGGQFWAAVRALGWALRKAGLELVRLSYNYEIVDYHQRILDAVESKREQE